MAVAGDADSRAAAGAMPMMVTAAMAGRATGEAVVAGAGAAGDADGELIDVDLLCRLRDRGWWMLEVCRWRTMRQLVGDYPG